MIQLWPIGGEGCNSQLQMAAVSGREPCMHLPLSAPTMRHECKLTLGSHSSTAMRACVM